MVRTGRGTSVQSEEEGSVYALTENRGPGWSLTAWDDCGGRGSIRPDLSTERNDLGEYILNLKAQRQDN